MIKVSGWSSSDPENTRLISADIFYTFMYGNRLVYFVSSE